MRKMLRAIAHGTQSDERAIKFGIVAIGLSLVAAITFLQLLHA